MDNREYVMDRIKKLTNALYRVTELLSDKEPLKWTLRDKAINIYDNFLKDKYIVLSDIIDMLDLFSPESSISNLNYDILKKEYKNLRSFIEENKKNIIPEQKLIIDFSIGQIPIGHIEEKEQKPKEKTIKTPVFPISSFRKEKIIEFLGQGPKTISEITPLFHEISEKSIQRDLFDLVKLGKVMAEGEKRWRKYKLLTNTTI